MHAFYIYACSNNFILQLQILWWRRLHRGQPQISFRLLSRQHAAYMHRQLHHLLVHKSLFLSLFLHSQLSLYVINWIPQENFPTSFPTFNKGKPNSLSQNSSKFAPCSYAAPSSTSSLYFTAAITSSSSSLSHLSYTFQVYPSTHALLRKTMPTNLPLPLPQPHLSLLSIFLQHKIVKIHLIKNPLFFFFLFTINHFKSFQLSPFYLLFQLFSHGSLVLF